MPDLGDLTVHIDLDVLNVNVASQECAGSDNAHIDELLLIPHAVEHYPQHDVD